jgi:hypothetical protein
VESGPSLMGRSAEFKALKYRRLATRRMSLACCQLIWSLSSLSYTLTLHFALYMSAPLSFDEEARLYTTNAEREKYESLATLYGIIVALDYLERAYVRDSVTAAECVVYIPKHTVLRASD